jgi:hypothetical protein
MNNQQRRCEERFLRRGNLGFDFKSVSDTNQSIQDSLMIFLIIKMNGTICMLASVHGREIYVL